MHEKYILQVKDSNHLYIIPRVIILLYFWQIQWTNDTFQTVALRENIFFLFKMDVCISVREKFQNKLNLQSLILQAEVVFTEFFC